jgi:hypothetical protein
MMDHAHKSNFTEAIENASSNVPPYASLVIRRRRNKRQIRHGVIDTYMMLNSIRRLPPQNANNPLFNGFIFP